MTGFEAVVGEAADEVGATRLQLLAEGVGRGESDEALRAAVPVSGWADVVTAVRAAQRVDGLPDEQAAAYLRGVADGYARSAAAERVEVVWSGPSTHAVPVRATAQALIDLIDGARSELLLMTYSAKPYRPVLDALIAARGRAVRVAAVVETLQGAAGSLGGSVEPAAAFIAVPGLELWHWPADRRGGPTAKMHAKVAVADRRALLVSSANLTQSGVAHSIEAGLLVRGGHAPRRIAEHVEQLTAAGELVRLHPE